ncbi:hypothetical protein [Aporhodopirellula aestuarii]|uniref:Uncharacterized protein n=1 Tax=Aporhodopirellula aestuarii TaxID=2950107 RepID=A0ABT0UAX5_9BACT|nr:hypothetical protein [Aporhodopirellula aestuarii]MCM2373926.1 hypothetical protein [Aporhodopirellula aestuarii]
MTHCFYSPLLGEMICDATGPATASPKSVGAADQLLALADKLDAACYRISDQVDTADRAIDAVDRAIQRAHRLGLCHRQFAMGPVSIRRLYGPDGPPECLEFVQAAITTDHGCSAVVWSSDDYQEWQEGDEAYEAAFKRCVPLRDCRPAVRVALLRHLPELLRSLLRGVESSLATE